MRQARAGCPHPAPLKGPFTHCVNGPFARGSRVPAPSCSDVLIRCPRWVWALLHGLDPQGVPSAPTGDLFDLLSDELPPEDLVRPDGHLRADAVTGAWLTTPQRCAAFAEAARQVARHQHEGRARAGRRALATAHAESAAAVLCVELASDGLPIDREAARRLVTDAAGPRPGSDPQSGEPGLQAGAEAERGGPGHRGGAGRAPDRGGPG